jgi:hypothetical protein
LSQIPCLSLRKFPQNRNLKKKFAYNIWKGASDSIHLYFLISPNLAKHAYKLWPFEQHHKIEKKKRLLGMLEGNVRQIPYCLAASTLIIIFSKMLKMSKKKILWLKHLWREILNLQVYAKRVENEISKLINCLTNMCANDFTTTTTTVVTNDLKYFLKFFYIYSP